jgi:hypothetical protein
MRSKYAWQHLAVWKLGFSTDLMSCVCPPRRLASCRLLAEELEAFHGVMDLGGIDPDIPNLLPISENAADLDGVAVNHADDLDYG